MDRFSKRLVQTFSIILLGGYISSCKSQPPAPIEFKSGGIKNDTSKYSIPDIDEEVTSSNLSKIPTESAPVTYLVEDTIDNAIEDKKPVAREELETTEQDTPIAPKSEIENQKPQIPNTASNKVAPNLTTQNEPKDLDTELEVVLNQPVKDNKTTVAKNAPATPTPPKQQAPEGLASALINPVSGRVIKTFDAKNQGINIEAPLRAPVQSVYDGQVVYSGYDNKFGNLIILKLDKSDFFIAFAHLDDLIVTKGHQVEQGELIGHVGQTGNVEQPQLYLAVKKGKVALDPLKYFAY
jgi:murein DD-endopeptidase MepM/ murein hydrolase activator NlpD